MHPVPRTVVENRERCRQTDSPLLVVLTLFHHEKLLSTGGRALRAGPSTAGTLLDRMGEFDRFRHAHGQHRSSRAVHIRLDGPVRVEHAFLLVVQRVHSLAELGDHSKLGAVFTSFSSYVQITFCNETECQHPTLNGLE